MDVLDELQTWYAAQCNGEWEHDYGIKIESCDNPGWWVQVDLVGTKLFQKPFSTIAENVDAEGFQEGERWLHCHLEDGVWNGAGDETKLATIIREFLKWAN